MQMQLATPSPVQFRLFHPQQPPPAKPCRHPLTAEESLYFLHIPKTAGTSLRLWMAQNFSADQTLPNMSYEEVVKIPAAEIANKRFIVGHFGIAFGKHYPPPSRTVTWLREPVARSISEYYYWQRHVTKESGLPRVVWLPSVAALEDCLSDPDFSRSRANIQTHSLGAGHWDPARVFLTDSQLLAHAANELENLEFFGITEQMQASIDMLSWQLGWRPIRFDVHENRATRADDISPRSRELASDMNRLDSELYSLACRQLEQRFRLFLREIARFADEQRLSIPDIDGITLDNYDTVRNALEPCFWKQYHFQSTNEPRSTSCTFTFDQPLRGEGWGERERQKTMISLPFRWMNRPEATIDLPLRRDVPLNVRIRIANTLGQPLALRADETPIELRPVTGWNQLGVPEQFYVGQLPAVDTWATKLTTLTFSVPTVLRPCDLNPNSHDRRTLGVAIDWISIEP